VTKEVEKVGTNNFGLYFIKKRLVNAVVDCLPSFFSTHHSRGEAKQKRRGYFIKTARHHEQRRGEEVIIIDDDDMNDGE
jgi:hypothetical protein